MVYSADTVSSSEQSAQAADKPILCAKNALDDRSAISGDPKWTTDGLSTGTDVTDPIYPASMAYDRFIHAATRPTDQSVNTYHFNMKLDDSLGNVIDMFALLGHNLGTLATDTGSTISLTVTIDDNGSFNNSGGNRVNIVSESSVTSDQRIVILSLAGAFGSYTDVQWIRVTITATGGTGFSGTDLPRFSEILLGKRRQLSSKPNAPHDPYNLQTMTYSFVTDDGTETNKVRGSRQAIIEADWTASDSDPFTLDDAATLLSWWRDCNGHKAGLWVGNPNSDQNYAHWVKPPRKLARPFVEAQIRPIKLVLTECKEYVDVEVNG